MPASRPPNSPMTGKLPTWPQGGHNLHEQVLAPALTGKSLTEPTDMLSANVFGGEVIDRLQALEHAAVASGLNQLKCWVEALKLDAGIGGCKAPVSFDIVSVADAS